MSDAGLSGSDIAKVLMVGGSSRIPAVQEMVTSRCLGPVASAVI